jgi:hypothetical protein
MNPNLPRYTLRDLDNAITNLPDGLLQMWIHRGVLKLQETKIGRGKKRLFSFAEAIQVEIMAFMAVKGMPSKLSAAVGLASAEYICEWIESGKILDFGLEDDEWPILVYSDFVNEKLRHKIITKDKVNANLGMFFTVIDFYYGACRLYEALEEAVVHRERVEKNKPRGCDPSGFPLDPEHPWNKPEGSK